MRIVKLFVLISLLIAVSFGAGYYVKSLIKPPLPKPGPVEMFGYWDAERGDMYCFDEASFENMSAGIAEMMEHFEKPE